MFQDPYASLDPRMRVREIIAEPLDIARRGTAKERAGDGPRSLLDEVGLPADAMDRYPHEFSGGQRQRLGLARALALNPKLIVADEPVSALDVSIRSQVLNLMKRLQASHGLTYIVISHDLSVVRYLADRIGVMYLGKLVEIGTGDDIYERAGAPLHGRACSRRSRCRTRSSRASKRREVADPGRAALAAQPAVGLPLPDPLPARPGHVRRGGAAAARRSAASTSPRATSRSSRWRARLELARKHLRPPWPSRSPPPRRAVTRTLRRSTAFPRAGRSWRRRLAGGRLLQAVLSASAPTPIATSTSPAI